MPTLRLTPWKLLALTALCTRATAQQAPTTNAAADIPVFVVRGSPTLQEEAPVGPYQQPDWTTERRFPTTRVYLQAEPWAVAVEQWVRSKFDDGERGRHRIQQEVEIGLPYRMQADLYVNSEMQSDSTWYYDNFAAELRYAFADWGKLPLNPAVYGEYKFKDSGPDVAEAKLLLGDVIGGVWNWGANAAFEWDLGGSEKTEEYAVALAVGRAVIDRKLSLGLEALYASESVKGDRGNPEESLNIGPSLQWRPTPKSHLDLVVMPGLTDDAPDWLTFLVFGFDIGSLEEHGLVPRGLESK